MPERLSLPREGTGRRKTASPGTETASRGPGLPASGTARSLLRTPLGGWCPAVAEPTKMPCLLKRKFGALARDVGGTASRLRPARPLTVGGLGTPPSPNKEHCPPSGFPPGVRSHMGKGRTCGWTSSYSQFPKPLSRRPHALPRFLGGLRLTFRCPTALANAFLLTF